MPYFALQFTYEGAVLGKSDAASYHHDVASARASAFAVARAVLKKQLIANESTSGDVCVEVLDDDDEIVSIFSFRDAGD